MIVYVTIVEHAPGIFECAGVFSNEQAALATLSARTGAKLTRYKSIVKHNLDVDAGKAKGPKVHVWARFVNEEAIA